MASVIKSGENAFSIAMTRAECGRSEGARQL